MDDVGTIVGVLIAAVIFGGICALLATARELKSKQWFLYGLFLGPLALLALALFPKDWLIGFQKE
jgi:ABC-type branched-subunit amino acid transport system permease subunit